MEHGTKNSKSVQEDKMKPVFLTPKINQSKTILAERATLTGRSHAGSPKGVALRQGVFISKKDKPMTIQAVDLKTGDNTKKYGVIRKLIFVPSERLVHIMGSKEVASLWYNTNVKLV